VALGIIVALAWLAEKERLLPVLLASPVIFFLSFLFLRNRAATAWSRAAQAANYFGQRLSWLNGSWAGCGNPGTRFLDEPHPFALDLDLFGTGGLFELLCTARTRMGEDTIAAWLLCPAAPEEVRERQAAVAELRPLLDLREDIAFLGSQVPIRFEIETLASWGKARPMPVSLGAGFAAIALMVLTLAALAGCILGIGPLPLLLAGFLEAGFTFRRRRHTRSILAPLEPAIPILTALSTILARLERERFSSPRLHRLCAGLDAGGRPSSQRVAQLRRLLSWWPLAGLFLQAPQVAWAVEAWRRNSGSALARWLTAVGDFEALVALATYSFENPEDIFPDIVANDLCFEAEGLGHPLLPRDQCVRNDLHLSSKLRLQVVSGSNMSGKSTFLRTIGVNTVLAMAGAPVRAHRMRVSALTVGATLRIQDSLQAGRSRFYAEILRLRCLIDLAKGPRPLLFLLDELLEGTNSLDRRLAAEAVLRCLTNLGAIGLVTTHDLALTDIVDLLAPQATNVHFEDKIEKGRINFDYRLRPGIVQHSNALALMRAVGIEV